MSVFHSFPSGEVVLMGAHLQPQKGAGGTGVAVAVSFRFGLDEDEANIQVRPGNELTIPLRPAWHYVWAFYREEDDAGPPIRKTVRAQAAYVEKLLRDEDYAILGLG